LLRDTAWSNTARVAQLAGAGQALSEPERAAQERSLVPVEPVLTPVAVQQAVPGAELLAHRGDRPEHPLVVPGDIFDGREQEQGGVHLGSPECLHVHPSVTVVASLLDRFPQLVAGLFPAARGGPAHALVGQANAAIERGPAEHLRVDEVIGVAGPLPDAAIGFVPSLRRVVDQRDQEAPVVVARRVAAPVRAPGQVDQLSVGVELDLPGGVVADPDRRRSPVTGDSIHDVAAQPSLSAHAVEDLEILGVAGGRAHDEGAEGVRLVHRAELGERPGAEARVAHPGVAVVPVACGADGLGQRRGRGGDDRAGGRVGERLEHDARPSRRGFVATAEAKRRRPLAPPRHGFL
jgi:hypothetical protein